MQIFWSADYEDEVFRKGRAEGYADAQQGLMKVNNQLTLQSQTISHIYAFLDSLVGIIRDKTQRTVTYRHLWSYTDDATPEYLQYLLEVISNAIDGTWQSEKMIAIYKSLESEKTNTERLEVALRETEKEYSTRVGKILAENQTLILQNEEQFLELGKLCARINKLEKIISDQQNAIDWQGKKSGPKVG